jgi:hypothetical protein
MKMRSFWSIVFAAVSLVGCSNQFEASSTQLADTVKNNIGCSQVKSIIFDSMYNFLETEKISPTSGQLEGELRKKIASISSDKLDKMQLNAIADEVIKIYALMNEKSNAQRSFNDFKEHLHFLIQLEFGNQSSEAHVEINRQIDQSIKKVLALRQGLTLACDEPSEPVTPSPVENPPPQFTAVQFGGLYAFATAYQSCRVLSLPDISASTENVVGVQLNEDVGGGFARSYASIPEIQRTHYYIRGITYDNGCFPVKDRPLVYDFGGTPAVEKNRLNFFTNAGIGGSALGLDCSAFISSAVATAGLRYSPGVSNKPIFVRQTSYDFIDPEISGWKCFDRVTVTPDQSLVPGDIMAVQGHVVMVDHVGDDAFGISRITSKDQCARLSYSKFDFSILQSSPSKGSIGINRFIAKDYLIESEKMRAAFLGYAEAACNSKFTHQPIKVQNKSYGLIRHKGTAECTAPRVELAGQSCISSCGDLRTSSN